MENFIFCAAWLSFKHQNIIATSNQSKAHNIEISLIVSFKILKNGQTCFKDLAVRASEDFKNMFGHFSTLCMKGLLLGVNLLTIRHKGESQNGGNETKHAKFF